MKAWRIARFGIENLQLVELPDPVPGPREVLIRIAAVSLNFRDLMVVKGLYNPKMQLPRIPCSDGAGEVVAVGGEVSRVRVGDRVAGIFMQHWLDGRATPANTHGALGGDIDGMLREYAVLDEDGVIEFPGHYSFAEGATLPCAGLTAWNALTRAASIGAGDTVVVQGTGGVSIFALQFAKLLGARVLGTSSSDEKLQRARSLGLDAGVNYRKSPDWERWVIDQTGGLGADLIVEVGGAETLQQSLKAVKMGGTIAQIGVLTGTKQPVDLAPILHKQVKIHGVYVGSRSDFAAMNAALVGAGASLKPVISRQFGMPELAAGLQAMAAGSHFGKTVIRVSE